MLSEEEINGLYNQCEGKLGAFARAIERAVLERAAGACKEAKSEMVVSKFSSANACFWARTGADCCADAILALLPKEES